MELKVYNPYNGEVVDTLEENDSDHISELIEKIREDKTLFYKEDRADILTKVAKKVKESKKNLAELVTKEVGKPIKESELEVDRVVNILNLSAESALNSEKFFDLEEGAGIYQPRGIVLAITPFNYPLALLAHKLGPSFAVGNKTIIKPSEQAPLAAYKFVEMFQEISGSDTFFSSFITSNSYVRDRLIKSDVDVISFTGGTNSGRLLTTNVGIKKLILELGDISPLLVLPDADLEAATDAVVNYGAFDCNGQKCTSIKRILLEDSIADEFIDMLKPKVEALVTGDPMDYNTDIGPQITLEAAEYLKAQVYTEDTINETKIITGAKLIENNIYLPTVLDQVPPTSQIVSIEVLGPIAPIIRYSGIDSAIEIINSTGYGLQAGVFTKNPYFAKEASLQINTGTVNINKGPGFRYDEMPFGGVGKSGYGLEGVPYAFKEFSNLKRIQGRLK